LEDKHDFIRLRAETDSKALKQKYSDSIDFSKANIIVKGLLS